MAYIVSRADGRHEIRESRLTPRGPRARTLATFRVLTDAVLDHAESRAETRFDRERVIQIAIDRDIPRAPDDPAALSLRLVAAMERHGPLPEAFADVLRDALSPGSVTMSDTLNPAREWIAATATDRGDTLRDLLRMTDRLPERPRPPRRHFPRISSRPV